MTALYYLTFVAWFVSEISIGVRATRRAGGRREDRLSGPVLVAGMFVAVELARILADRFPGYAIPDRHAVFYLGVAVAFAGIALRQFAVARLGLYFTVRVMTSSDQRVVESGPYRYIRHPSYTGLLLTLLGLLICPGNWLAVLCFLLSLPGFAYRIHIEEQALVHAIGKPYQEYMTRTKRLVPFVV